MNGLTELLDKRGIYYKKTNNPNEILISCTSGDHEDKNASLAFNIEKQMFHCWSCGFSGGATKFMASIGETVILDLSSRQPYRLKKLKDKLQAKIDLDEIKLPEDRKIIDEEFKGVSKRILREFNVFTTDTLGLSGYVCIPVYQFGKLKFIEGRLSKDLSNQPKYYRRPDNVSVIDCMFPIDKIKNVNYVILVEGIFDMLNMWQLGYKNTLCVFGATNFSNKKLDLLDRLGVNRVDIMFDPDQAGQKGAEKISNMLDSRNIYSRIIKLPDGIDPGDLHKNLAERLLK